MRKRPLLVKTHAEMRKWNKWPVLKKKTPAIKQILRGKKKKEVVVHCPALLNRQMGPVFLF